MNYIQERILYYLEDLDTRRALGQAPRKLKPLEGFVIPEKYYYYYFYKSKKLMQICPDIRTQVYSPVELSVCGNNYYIFNLNFKKYTYEYYAADGSVMVDPASSVPIVTCTRIKFIE